MKIGRLQWIEYGCDGRTVPSRRNEAKEYIALDTASSENNFA